MWYDRTSATAPLCGQIYAAMGIIPQLCLHWPLIDKLFCMIVKRMPTTSERHLYTCRLFDELASFSQRNEVMKPHALLGCLPVFMHLLWLLTWSHSQHMTRGKSAVNSVINYDIYWVITSLYISAAALMSDGKTELTWLAQNSSKNSMPRQCAW
jgi:hypothetical protein